MSDIDSKALELLRVSIDALARQRDDAIAQRDEARNKLVRGEKGDRCQHCGCFCFACEQPDSTCSTKGLRAERDAAIARAERGEQALAKLNAIRNSIIGCQGFNFSEHAYPMVAALNEAGLVGEPYPVAKANVGTLIERTNKAEADLAKLTRVKEAAEKAVDAHRGSIDGDWACNHGERVSTDCPMVALREALAGGEGETSEGIGPLSIAGGPEPLPSRPAEAPKEPGACSACGGTGVRVVDPDAVVSESGALRMTPFPPGRCSTRCDHDSQCTLSAGHGDRHETDHGCICYDPTRDAL